MNARYIIRASSFANSPLPIDGVPDFNRRVTYALSALQSGSVYFTGQICQMGQVTAPAGWLVCDGSALSRTAFPALYEAIGTSYGVGDGSTTFNIPTQAQCVPDVAVVLPPQVITGGSVVPITTPTTTTDVNPVGGTGGNSVVGGRPPSFDEILLVDDR